MSRNRIKIFLVMSYIENFLQSHLIKKICYIYKKDIKKWFSNDQYFAASLPIGLACLSTLVFGATFQSPPSIVIVNRHVQSSAMSGRGHNFRPRIQKMAGKSLAPTLRQWPNFSSNGPVFEMSSGKLSMQCLVKVFQKAADFIATVFL